MKKNMICLDVQTTGLSYDDEILQLTILNEDGEILFHHYIKPRLLCSWYDAEEVYGITQEMVRCEKTITMYKEELQKIFDNADVVIGYNIHYFDSVFLKKAGLKLDHLQMFDVMEEFAPIFGETSEYFNQYIWQSLETCCKYYGYKLPEGKKNSLENAKATLYCFKEMMKNDQ